MIRRIAILLLLIGWQMQSQAQDSHHDSLVAALPMMAKDRGMVDVLNELAGSSFAFSIPESRHYAKRALHLAQEIQYLAGEALAGYQLTLVYNAEGKVDSGHTLVQRVVENAVLLRDSVLIGRALISQGLLLGKLEHDSLAIAAFYQALDLGEALHDYRICADAASGLATINTGLGYYNRSLEYLQQSLEYAEKLNDPKLIVKYCVNLSILNDSTTKRRYYAEKALHIARRHPNMNRELTYAYNVMGMLHYYNLNNADSALWYKKKALQLAKTAQEPHLILMISSGIAEVYREINLDSSAKYYQELLSDTTVQTYAHHQEGNLHKLSQIKFLQGATHEAYKLLDSSYSLATDRYRKSLENAVADANAKYETEKREAALAKQELLIAEQRNDRNRILIFGGLLLAGLAWLGQFTITRHKRKRRETELALHFEKQRAADLENLSQVKTVLFNNVSHELRTPLTMIIGPLEQSLTEIKNVTLKKNVELALQNSRRITALVNEILDLSKLDAGKMGIELTTINLLGFLNRIYFAFSSLAASQEIDLQHNLEVTAAHDVFVETDANKLEKIINNLVSNAIKYSGPGNIVSLNLNHEALEEGRLQLTVEDQGPGISEVDQKYIFDRYYQVSGQSHSSGTGIGLALTKELVELLKGWISVESDGHSGSIFTIDIPVSKSGASKTLGDISKSERPMSDVAVHHLSGGQPKILIVEDDLQMGKYLKGILSTDFECALSYNGRQALEILSRQNFDLISTDIMMPEMDGFEFRRRINEIPQYQNIPFIMLTARALEEDKLRGFQLGIDDYLTKPFSADELRARIKNLLKNKISRSKAEEDNISFDDDLIEKARNIVAKHMSDPSFKVTQLASELNYSARQFARILKKCTGLSPVEFVLELRLLQAYRRVQERRFSTLSEVQYDIGIESASYFSSKFKERFGITPSQLAKSTSIAEH